MSSAVRAVACVDLFCGAGGLSLGLARAGVAVVAGIDVEEDCRVSYEAVAPFLRRDVTRLEADEIAALYGSSRAGSSEVRVLAGCAPCQPFSIHAHRVHRRRAGGVRADSRWGLLYELARLIEAFRPEVVVTENVPGVVRHAVYREFVARLRDLGYPWVWSETVDCFRWGVPQNRQRHVLLASRLGPIGLDEPQDYVVKTVRDAIGHLAPLEAGQADPLDPLHRAAALSPLNLERIRASRPGGSWRDWPEALLAACQVRASGHSYPSMYGRMVWDEPAPTITTQFYNLGSGRFGHPGQDRALSLREGALLQGFPEAHPFPARLSMARIGRLIGNAVPPPLGRAIGRAILDHVGERSCPQTVPVTRWGSRVDAAP